jgi:transcriptional regulator with PAS, ATPase and Fis domain
VQKEGNVVDVSFEDARDKTDLFRVTWGSHGTFTLSLREILLAHTWPGNIRELENVLERAVVFLNLADDPEMCALMVEAGFKKVFVGIETPSVEALEECHKFHSK